MDLGRPNIEFSGVFINSVSFKCKLKFYVIRDFDDPCCVQVVLRQIDPNALVCSILYTICESGPPQGTEGLTFLPQYYST